MAPAFSTGHACNNSGLGFPLQTEILKQPLDSDDSIDYNFAVVAAIRDNRVDLPTTLEVSVKRITPGLPGFDWDTRRVEMVRWKEINNSGFTLFSASFTELPSNSSSTWYSLTNDEVTLEMLKTGDLPKGCSEW
ncbi:wsc domain containing protein [Moniliophthora roreri]|nr:wsc domain containing protein [Moniliophthora roreri]